MADHYIFVLEDKEEPIGTPKWVFVELTHSLIGANTWSIGNQNNWIGTGSGVYRVNGNEVELRDGSWSEGRTRVILKNINYPADLKGSGGHYERGAAQYVSAARQISGASCEWQGRNIIPDQY